MDIDTDRPESRSGSILEQYFVEQASLQRRLGNPDVPPSRKAKQQERLQDLQCRLIPNMRRRAEMF